MTPKEKSQQLINDFYDTTYNSSNDYDERHRIAKQCALISVDEVYKLNLKLGQHLEEDEDKINYYSYWEQVKKEIEKL